MVAGLWCSVVVGCVGVVGCGFVVGWWCGGEYVSGVVFCVWLRVVVECGWWCVCRGC